MRSVYPPKRCRWSVARWSHSVTCTECDHRDSECLQCTGGYTGSSVQPTDCSDERFSTFCNRTCAIYSHTTTHLRTLGRTLHPQHPHPLLKHRLECRRLAGASMAGAFNLMGQGARRDFRLVSAVSPLLLCSTNITVRYVVRCAGLVAHSAVLAVSPRSSYSRPRNRT